MDKTKTEPTKLEINSKDSNWGWFSVWKSNNTTNTNNSNSTGKHTPNRNNSNHSNATENEFEVVQQEIASKSYTASYDQVLLENNLEQKINDQYVNLNEYGTTLPVHPIDDDDEKPVQDKDEINHDTVEIDNNNINNIQIDPVMISQTLTLKTRNEELEKEREELQSETLQLRMQTQCLRQTNEHIIAAQQSEIEKLQNSHKKLNQDLNSKIEQLKAAQISINSLQRERDNLKKKLYDICYNRLHTNNMIRDDKNTSQNAQMQSNDSNVVVVSDKHVIYGCIQCGCHLFDSRALIQRQIEIDDNTFGLIVDGLIGNNTDTTMGPTVCKTFINGMFKVKEVFCDGCLSTFGWKISESFDEWNEFYANKFCIDISTIKQI